MSNYLVARPFTSDPFLEIWQCSDAGTAPVEVEVRPKFYGPVEQVKFSENDEAMVSVTRYLREDIPGLGSPDDPTQNNSAIWISDDDEFILVSKPRGLYHREGPYYIAVPESDFPWGTSPATDTLRSAAISAGANVIIVASAFDDTKIRVYDRNEGTNTWTLKQTLTNIGPAPKLSITPDSQYIIDASINTGIRRLYHLTGSPSSYQPVGESTGTYTIVAWTITAGGVLRISKNGTTIWDVVGSVFTQVGGSLPSPTTGTGTVTLGGFKFAYAGTVFFRTYGNTAVGTNSARYIAGYYLTGTTWTLMAGPVFPNANTNYPNFPNNPALNSTETEIYVSVDFLGTSSVDYFFALSIVNTGGVFSLVERAKVTIPTPTTLAAPIVSPDDKTFHGYQLHVDLSTMTVLTEIPELPGTPAVSIRRIDIGKLGQAMVIYISTSTVKPVVVTRDGRGSYLDARTLEGTFVTVYDRDDNSPLSPKPFKQRTFVQHILGTDISDILFSPEASALTYHASNDNNAEASGLGRFVYDLGANDVVFRAVLWASGDQQSFAAFKPEEDYLVVVFHNDAVGNTIKLYQLTPQFVPTLKDSDAVSFGPVAYSHCETVVVAHGGPIPYSLFSHIYAPDTLVPITLPAIDWSIDSEIIALKFTGDCNGLAIVMPGEIIVIDPSSGEEEDASEDGPGGNADTNPAEVKNDGNGGLIIYNPIQPGDGQTPDTGGSGPPTWAVDGGTKTISNDNYIPYVAVNVTYRTR